MATVFVTVGMNQWPFDRLLEAVRPLCDRHDVFAQVGTSSVALPCETATFIEPHEVAQRIAQADVVITHAGNTVRLVQRAGRVPIAVAREQARGEMGNDHQVRYLEREVHTGRVVVAAGDLHDLGDLVGSHASTEARLLAERAAPPEPASADLQRLGVGHTTGHNPFADHPVARYRWVFDQLARRHGRHLELGANEGELLEALADHTALEVVGVDPMAQYLGTLRARRPDIAAVQIDARQPLPFPDATFQSATALDVLEHVASEDHTLGELHRVLAPGGLLLVTVPAQHWLSVLDPDNAKLKMPRLHAAVYRRRFGDAEYHRRFVDLSDGMRGDLAVERTEHTNYEFGDLQRLLEHNGFAVTSRDGANLFWRFFDIPRLLAPARARGLFTRPLVLDGRLFRSANLFLAAERLP
jgi:SAM-dependent methyltransferase